MPLYVEALLPALPLFTDDEANIVRKFIALHYPTLAKYIMNQYFPNIKLRPLHTADFRKLLHHCAWDYIRGPHHDNPDHDYDDRVDELCIFMTFATQKYFEVNSVSKSMISFGI